VVREPFTVEEKMSLIEERVGAGGTCTFEELFSEDAIRMEVVVTFIAILELVKRGRLQFMQTEPCAAIWLPRPGLDDEMAAALAMDANVDFDEEPQADDTGREAEA